MRLTVIGCSGSFPGPDGPASCYLVEADGFALVLDLGNGAFGALQRYTDVYEVGAVFLSHLHADHCLDLCSYWVARKYRPSGVPPRLPVYGPSGAADRMAAAYGLDPEPGMGEVFDFREVAETQQIGPFTISAAAVSHPVEAYGFRIEHGGRAIAYSGDSGETDALVGLAEDVDLFLCEASFLDQPGLPYGVHLTGRQAAEHARRARARSLVLTHLVPWNKQSLVLAEAKETQFTGEIQLATAGAVYDL